MANTGALANGAGSAIERRTPTRILAYRMWLDGPAEQTKAEREEGLNPRRTCLHGQDTQCGGSGNFDNDRERASEAGCRGGQS